MFLTGAGTGPFSVADMKAWAEAHSLARYSQQRSNDRPPYGMTSENEHKGFGHDIIALGECSLLTADC